VRLASFDGQMIWEGDQSVHVSSNASRPVAHWTAEQASGAPNRYLSVSSRQDSFPFNRHFFAAIKDLERAPVEPHVEISPTGDHRLSVRLEAPTYAYFVHLEVSHEATRFSDNYFDLAPGEQRTISVTNEKQSLQPANINVRWR
jgi:beta-mannosidase